MRAVFCDKQTQFFYHKIASIHYSTPQRAENQGLKSNVQTTVF